MASRSCPPPPPPLTYKVNLWTAISWLYRKMSWNIKVLRITYVWDEATQKRLDYTNSHNRRISPRAVYRAPRFNLLSFYSSPANFFFFFVSFEMMNYTFRSGPTIPENAIKRTMVVGARVRTYTNTHKRAEISSRRYSLYVLQSLLCWSSRSPFFPLSLYIYMHPAMGIVVLMCACRARSREREKERVPGLFPTSSSLLVFSSLSLKYWVALGWLAARICSDEEPRRQQQQQMVFLYIRGGRECFRQPAGRVVD